MSNRSKLAIKEVVGLDLGDKHSRICVLDFESAEVIEEAKVRTTAEALERRFSKINPMRIVLEVGTHSPWVSELLERLGHEVIVANPRKVALIYRNRRKNDRVDAELLARLGRSDPQLLKPICHRGREARADLALLRSRDALIKARTQLINRLRGIVKSVGSRLPSCSADTFGIRSIADAVPDDVKAAALPMLEIIDDLSSKIRQLDRQITRVTKEKYPVAVHLMTIGGVGPLTALSFVLTIEDPGRFPKSRSVGPYLGLVPASDDSGDHISQMRISKEGDAFVRRLLVNGAHYIIGNFGKDCDLRRHGLKIAARGGKNAKKRAAIAVARKLAVLMHRLWSTGEDYDPFYNSKNSTEVAQAQNA